MHSPLHEECISKQISGGAKRLSLATSIRETAKLPCAAREAHGRNKTHGKRLISRVPQPNTHTAKTRHRTNCPVCCEPSPRHMANKDTLTSFEPAVRVCHVLQVFAVCWSCSTRQSFSKKIDSTLNFF